MTIKPITFSAPMVRALIEGRKTQTRRVLKPQPSSEYALHFSALYEKKAIFRNNAHGIRQDVFLPHAVGDLLWVREAFQLYPEYDHLPPAQAVVEGDLHSQSWDVYYNADNPDWFWDSRKRNARFMPRALSRITLEVTGVKVERLQDISEADAIAEGMYFDDLMSCYFVAADGFISGSAVSVYRELWDSLYSDQTDAWKRWEANPWVAAYEFKVHLKNVDEVVR